MAKYFIAIAVLLMGCATPLPPREVVRTVRVEVPVPIRPNIPDRLATAFAAGEVPQFVSIADESARSCLTEAGEQDLKQLVFDLYSRVRAWEAWAAEPLPIDLKPP